MGRNFVMGDIHGACRALKQCLERASFDYEHDRLICLGDVCDGWPETKACIDTLLSIKQLTYILGNHDWWTLEWMTTGGGIDSLWFSQGGAATIQSYAADANVPESHHRFLSEALPYLEWHGKLFVHAGFDTSIPINVQGLDILLWDRKLARTTLEHFERKEAGKLTTYDEVFLGHTPITKGTPLEAGGVWLMDTGAGWSGVLSMMDIETKEVFMSDNVPSLYPGITGRTRK